MEMTQRWLLTMSIGTTLALGACRFDSEAGSKFLEDAKKIGHYLRALNAAVGRQDDLRLKEMQIAAAVKMKEQWARDVLEGRISLRDAARRFANADFGVGYDWDYLKKANPEMSLESRCGIYMVESIEYVLEAQRCCDTDVLAKFRAVVQSWQER